MLFVMWLKSSKKLLLGVVGAVSLMLAVGFMPSKWGDRIETIETYQQDSSAMSRLTMWKYGLNVAMDRPLVGGGFEVFPAIDLYPRFGLRICSEDRRVLELSGDCVIKARSAHSIYFQVLGEHGFVGLVLFLMIGILALRSGTAIIRMSKNRAELKWAADLGAMLQVSLVGYAVGGVFLNKAYFDLYYHIIALVVMTRFTVERLVTAVHDRRAPALAAHETGEIVAGSMPRGAGL